MLRQTEGKVRGTSMSCFTLINGFLLILVAGDRWGYMLPRPPVIPEPEKIHWYYGNSLKYFFLKHIFLLLGEHLHPSLEQSPLSGLETTSFLPCFLANAKSFPKRLKETTQRWCANYMIKNGLEFVFNLNIKFPFFSSKWLWQYTVSKNTGAPTSPWIAPSNDSGLRSCCFSRVPLSWITPMYWFTMVPYSMDRKDPRFETQLSVFFKGTTKYSTLSGSSEKSVPKRWSHVKAGVVAPPSQRHHTTPKGSGFWARHQSTWWCSWSHITCLGQHRGVFFLHPSRSCVSDRRLTLGRKRVFFATKDKNASKFLCKFCSGKTR